MNLTYGMLVEVAGVGMGYVQFVNTDGTIAVNLIGEGNRVDYWHPTQVKLV